MSQIDKPQKTLNPLLWDLTAAEPVLQDTVRTACIDLLDKICLRSEILSTQETWLDGFSVVGSQCTNQYHKDSGLDLEVKVNWGALRRQYGSRWPTEDGARAELAEAFQTGSAQAVSWCSPNIRFVLVDDHSLQATDFRYNILDESWGGAPPELIPLDFNPSAEFRHLRKKAVELGYFIDKVFGDLRKASQDYLRCFKALQGSSGSELGASMGRSITFLGRVQKGLQGAQKVFERVWRLRQGALTAGAGSYPSVYKYSSLWTADNIFYKYLEHYGYTARLADLYSIAPTAEDLPTVLDVQEVRVVLGSILDYPHRSLDEDVWDVSGDEPKLREEAADEIINRFMDAWESRDYDSEWVLRFEFLGSMATLQYNRFSDIDINVVIDRPAVENSLGLDGSDEEFKDFRRPIARELNGQDYADTLHPVNYYIVGEDFVPSPDAIYDINTGVWEKPYPELPFDFDPDKEFKDVRETVQVTMDNLDLMLAETKRDLIDYDLILEALEGLGSTEQAFLAEKLHDKLLEIESGIEDLAKEYVDIRDTRNELFLRDDSDGLLSYEHSKNWAPENVQEKYLDRYKYISVLQKLREIAEDGVVPEEIDEIEDVLR